LTFAQLNFGLSPDFSVQLKVSISDCWRKAKSEVKVTHWSSVPISVFIVFSTGDSEEACCGTVVDDSDADTDSDDDDDDASDALERAVRQRHEAPKQHGTVRVMWEDTEPSGRLRVGRDGHVDVWCIAAAPGGEYYRDHLAVLDRSLMMSPGAADSDDDDDDDSDKDSGSCSFRTTTPLGNLSHLTTPLGMSSGPLRH